MAVLQCEICGGKLMAKSGGLFECEYCGMQYDKTRIQEMVQEIKGTVKVEGTVEVKGTVKLDGPVMIDHGADARNCALRAMQIIATRSLMNGTKSYVYEFNKKLRDEVRDVLNDALKIDPFCPEAHMGFLFREYWVSSFDELAAYVKKYDHDFRVNTYYENAEKHSRGTPLHDQLMAVIAELEESKNAKAYQEAVKLMEQQGYSSAEEILREIPGYRDADELRKKCEAAVKQKRDGGEALVRLYWETFPNSHVVVDHYGLIAALSGDGKVSVSVSEGSEEYRRNFEETVAQWSNVKDICICGLGGEDRPTDALIGLTKDGKILAAGMLGNSAGILKMQTDIAWMKTDGYHLAMVNKSGALLVVPRIQAMFAPGWNEAQMDWRNITYLRFDGVGQLVAYNQKNKWLGRVKGDYHYTEVVKDPSEYEKTKENTDASKRTFEYQTVNIYGVGDTITHKDLVEYHQDYKEKLLWAVTKDGDVLCGRDYHPQCINLGAVALFPSAWSDRKCLFLLADGSFAECEIDDGIYNISVKFQRIPNLRVYDGIEDLHVQQLRREQHIKELTENRESLKRELTELRGLFTGKRRKEIEAQLAEIETELKGLS